MKKSHLTPLNTSTEDIVFLNGVTVLTQPVFTEVGSIFNWDPPRPTAVQARARRISA